MISSTYDLHMIERLCCVSDLSTYDPYDIWKTVFGFHVKNFFNHHRYFGMLPAGTLAAFDIFVNNRIRLLYVKQEYPIVRALATLSLLNLYKHYPKKSYLEFARLHLQWLIKHSYAGYSGYCWGLGFRYAVEKNLIYDSNTPFSTMTPYVLEAFIEYYHRTGDHQFDDIILGIFNFFNQDIQIMEESDEYLATSYVPMRDRIVTNSISYTMYSLALIIPYVRNEQQCVIKEKINKLYSYIRRNQRNDGSWLYSPQGASFVDCFHSCIILKNLIKTNRINPLTDLNCVVGNGYNYIKAGFYNERDHLFRRFTVSNKPSIIRYDLYDNAEVLNLAFLMEDNDIVDNISRSIAEHFCRGRDIFSQIDVFGCLRNKNTLRWAVMPYIYALSKIAR